MENFYLSSENLPQIQDCWEVKDSHKSHIFRLDDPDYQLMMTWLQHEKIDMYCKTHQSIFELQKKIAWDDEIELTQSNDTEKLAWQITYIVEEGENLWMIIQKEFGYKKWSEISKKLQEVYKINQALTEKVYPWQEIQLPIDDIDEYTDRKFERWYKQRSAELKQIETDRMNKLSELQNAEWKVSMFQFIPEGFENRLDNNLYSWKLNRDAYEVYKNMKNTKGVQIIGQYRNRNWEVEDIILWDNKWKNIYMELDGSYSWDDIDSWKIDNISSQEKLEKVMVKLLKKYEKEK